jgi:hypothetical protein
MDEQSTNKSSTIGHVIKASDNAKVDVGDINFNNINGLRSEDLVSFIKLFFLTINRRDWEVVKAQIDSITSVSSAEPETNEVIKLLKYKSELDQSNHDSFHRDSIFDLLKSKKPSPFIKDVIESIYIHYLSTVAEGKAKIRFENSKYIGKYCKAIYYEKIANLESLKEAAATELEDKDEIELSALTRGALRCKDFKLAIKLATELDTHYTCPNSKILLLLAESCAIHKSIEGRHWWLISHDEFVLLNQKAELCLALHNSSNDQRIIQIAAILLLTYWCERADLVEVCKKNISEGERVVPALREFLSNDVIEQEDLNSVKEIFDTPKSEVNENTFHLLFSALAQGIISSQDIRKWKEKGGKLRLNSEVHTSFAKLLLESMAYDIADRAAVSELRINVETFCRDYKNRIEELHPLALYKLSTNLKALKMHSAIAEILAPIIPVSPWDSPILEVYAEALLESDQFVKLDSLFKSLKCINENLAIQSLKVERLIALNEFEQAISVIESLLFKNNHLCYFWSSLIRVKLLAQRPSIEISETISSIPKEILSKYSDEGIRLVQLAAQVDLFFSESIILEWFIENPVAMSTHVTNLHLNNLKNDYTKVENMPTSSRCSRAVVFKQNEKRVTKILVKNSPTNEYSVDINTPLGTILKEAKVGDKFELSIGQFEVLEVLPAIVGAVRISADIRSDINPGNDCFYKLTTDGSVEDILKKVDSFIRGKDLIEPELDGKRIPLLIRLNATHSNNLMNGCFQYLTDIDSNKHLSLFPHGEMDVSKLVLDAITLVYLSVSNLSAGLISTGIKLCITRETQQIVSQWLNQILDPDYLSLGKVNNNFYKTTADDIANNSSIDNLITLVEHCEVISPKDIDVPEMVMKLKDIIDISHYSSSKASLSHSIPILCLDPMMCEYYNQLNIALVNVYQLMLKASLSNPTRESNHLQSYVSFKLPVPIMYGEIVELSKQGGIKQYIAAQILRMHPNGFQSEVVALTILSECFIKSVCAAYLGNPKVDISLSEWRYTPYIVNSCCFAAMRCLDGKTCEARLAKFIARVFDNTRGIPDVNRISVALFSRFTRGHFLDSYQLNNEVKKLLKQS